MKKLLLIPLIAVLSISGVALANTEPATNETSTVETTEPVITEQVEPATETQPTLEPTSEPTPTTEPDTTYTEPTQETAPAPKRTHGRDFDPNIELVEPAPEAEPDAMTITAVIQYIPEPTEKNPDPLKSCRYTLYDGTTRSVFQPSTKPCQLVGDIFYAYN